MPVIVPDATAAHDVVAPPPASVAARMLQDLSDLASRPARPRLAVLTFDDGPYPVTTPVLLEQLRALDVPAVFFLIGNDAVRQPAISAAVTAAGIEIGNHSLSHPEMSTLAFTAQSAEIDDGATAIHTAAGVSPHYFRPPHGNFDADTITAARTSGEIVALWDVDPGDWRTMTPAEIVANVTNNAKAPAVILLHNGKEATIEALPLIVQAYRNAGFTFVTLSELQRRVPLEVINDPVAVDVP
jgi:peptidoglycan/xylan/chitin deacetylase (PgdA/CDA1 family)